MPLGSTSSGCGAERRLSNPNGVPDSPIRRPLILARLGNRGLDITFAQSGVALAGHRVRAPSCPPAELGGVSLHISDEREGSLAQPA